MRYALIMAGGSGTRLWPMSRADRPKQLIPFIGGRSLLELAVARLDGLVPAERQYICAGENHREPTLAALHGFDPRRYLAEPEGRDTLNAVGYAAAVIARRDADAVIAVFTADHLIEPVDKFQRIVEQGYAIVEREPHTLVTFGITPTHAATGYGYLQLGEKLESADAGAGDGAGAHEAVEARLVDEFKEKPPADLAQEYFDAGPDKYLWNSGMFVWRAATLLHCIARYEPANHAGLMRIAGAWDSDRRDAVLAEVYPTLKKISVDFAVMEPASKDPQVRVVALPLALSWLDVGSWPALAAAAATDRDDAGNAFAGGRHALLDTRGTLVASSDNNHVIAALGCENLIIVHTPDATLVCPKDQAERIKELHKLVGEKFGQELL